MLKQWTTEIKNQKSCHNTERIRIQSGINYEKNKLENIYKAIEKGQLKRGNIDERIEKIQKNISLFEEKLTKIRKFEKPSLSSHLLSMSFLKSFQGKIREVFFQNSALVKRYFKLFLEKIQVKREKVTIIARKDILLRVISPQNKGNFEKVLTAGVDWLPGLDDVDNGSQ